MAVSVSYNSVALTNLVGKFVMQQNDDRLTFSCDFLASKSWINTNENTVRVKDATLSITSGNWTKTVSTSEASEILPTLFKPAASIDSNANSRLTLLVEARMLTTNANGLQNYSITMDRDERDLKVITIEGVYTADSSDTAFENFTAHIATLQTTAEALYDSGSTDQYEEPRDIVSTNRTNGESFFTRTIREKALDDNIRTSGVDSNDTTLALVQWEATRTQQQRRGQSEEAPIEYTVNWGCIVPKTKSGSALVGQWDAQIRALVMNKTQGYFSDSNTLILLDESFTVPATGGEARGSFTVQTNETGPLSYSERAGLRVQYASFRKTLDGKDATGYVFTPGAEVRIVQEVTERRRDSIPSVPAIPTVTFNGKSLRLVVEDQEYDIESETVGREIGDGSDKTAATIEYTATYRIVYIGVDVESDSSGGVTVLPTATPFFDGGQVLEGGAV